MSAVQVASVKFGVDKRAADSFASYYGARSKNTKTYDYIWMRPDWIAINVGDEVVVKTPTHGMTVATVVEVTYFSDVEDSDAAWSLKPIYSVVKEHVVSSDYRRMQDNTIYYNEKLAERRKAERAQRAAEEVMRQTVNRERIRLETERKMERQKLYAEKAALQRMKSEAEAVLEERKKKVMEEMIVQRLMDSDPVFRELQESVQKLNSELESITQRYTNLS